MAQRRVHPAAAETTGPRIEILDSYLSSWAQDPSLMFRAAGIQPDEIQTAYLRDKGPRKLVNNTRQWGKSLCSAGEGYSEAICFPGSLVLIFAPAERQSKNNLKYAMDLHQRLQKPVAVLSDRKDGVEFANGSELVSLPGTEKTTRSFAAARRIIFDEASRIPDELYKSVRPMVAVSGGALSALSTPFSAEGWWAEEWHGNTDGYQVPSREEMRVCALGECDRCSFEGDLYFWGTRRLCELCWLDQHFWRWRRATPDIGMGWHRYRALAEECARIPDWFLNDERRALGPYWFRQEYCCQFLATEQMVFDPVALRRSIDDGLDSLHGDGSAQPEIIDMGDLGVEPLYARGERTEK